MTEPNGQKQAADQAADARPVHDVWRLRYPCHVTDERIRRVHSVLESEGEGVDVMVSSSGGHAPWEMALDKVITEGVYGQLRSLYLMTRSRSIQVSVHDGEGPSVVVASVASSKTAADKIRAEASKWRNLNQLPASPILVWAIFLLTLLLPVALNAYDARVERAQQLADVARRLEEVKALTPRPAASNPALPGSIAQKPADPPSNGSVVGAVAMGAVMVVVGAAIAAILIVILQPVWFLLGNLLSNLHEEYRRLFPKAWFDFPGMRGDYRSDTSRWAAIVIICGGSTSIFLAIRGA